MISDYENEYTFVSPTFSIEENVPLNFDHLIDI